MTRPFTDTETITWMSTLEKRMSSAAIALYDATGRVLVVKAHYKHYWSFPGGVVDAGETPRQAAVRETKEEVGVAVEADALAFCMVIDRVSTLAQTYQFIFEQQISAASLDTVAIDNSEIEAYALVTRDDIINGDRYYSETTKNGPRDIRAIWSSSSAHINKVIFSSLSGCRCSVPLCP